MVDKILEELKNKLNEVASCSNESAVSVILSAGLTTVNNIVKANEVEIYNEDISIQSGNFMVSFNYGNEANITKNDFGFESEYCIEKDDMSLYICLLGTE